MKKQLLKLIAAAIVAAMLLALGACSEGEGDSSTAQTTNDDEPVVAYTTIYWPPATTEPPAISTPAETDESTALPVSAPAALRRMDAGAAQSFFDDAVFVGDSITLGLKNYVNRLRSKGETVLGNAQFLVSGSLGAANSLWPVNDESVHPVYEGSQLQLWESLPKTGAKKLFFMLGLNDVGIYSLESSLQNYDTLISKVAEKMPGAKVFIMSATYMQKGAERGRLTSERLREHNLQLIDFCARRGYTFVNVADLFALPDGSLDPTYCSDGYVHLNEAAYIIFERHLYGFAAANAYSEQ